MNINDLSVLLAAVDIAVKRGAFSVLEVGTVSEAATKLNNFLGEAAKAAEAEKATEGQAEAAEQEPAAE